MLTEEERAGILKELARHEHPRAACLEALKIVQHSRGWISGEVRDIADLLGMTQEEVDAIATFYSFIYRRPVGRHVIHVCDSVCCWLTGYEGILGRIMSRLVIAMGETTEDGRFTLLPVSCIGACDKAPAMLINGELYTDLTPERVDEILDLYR